MGRKFKDLSSSEQSIRRLVGTRVKLKSHVPGCSCLVNIDDYDLLEEIVLKKLGEPTHTNPDARLWFLNKTVVVMRNKDELITSEITWNLTWVLSLYKNTSYNDFLTFMVK